MTVLLNFRHGGEDRLGVVVGDHVIDINRAHRARLTSEGVPNAAARAAAEAPSDALTFLQGGEDAVRTARSAVEYVTGLPDDDARRTLLRIPRAEVETLVPIKNPPKVICVARNFGAHAKEAGKEVSEIPIVFARFPSTLIPDGAEVIVPRVSHEVDWEGELAFVVGKPGRYISREDAMDHVAGYSIFNDVSVRNYQFRVTQYTSGKNFNASGPFGPVLVLADEALDPHALQITTTLSGDVVQDGNTSEMVFDIPTIIEHISEWIELEVGDVIAMGTPAGVGFTRQPPRFLTPGDTISVEIPGIGVLSNPVIADPWGER
ncbi:MAG: fumarylacetoacetate hydrolase family protein [bacterium]|nr:fumarylacetoacetate hydrolase family protein [bacterium]